MSTPAADVMEPQVVRFLQVADRRHGSIPLEEGEPRRNADRRQQIMAGTPGVGGDPEFDAMLTSLAADLLAAGAAQPDIDAFLASIPVGDATAGLDDPLPDVPTDPSDNSSQEPV